MKQRYHPAPRLCAQRDGFLYTAPRQTQPSCFAPDLEWPVFVFIYFLCFDLENAEGFSTPRSLSQNINGCVLTY